MSNYAGRVYIPIGYYGVAKIGIVMAKPYIHAKSSARRFGGKPEEYMEIHQLLDSSKGTIADNRHRALTHNSFFLSVIIEKIFGVTITNSDGKEVSTREVAEQHVLEDYGGKFIPTAQDFLQGIPFEPWMNNGKDGYPPSFKIMEKKEKETIIIIKNDDVDAIDKTTEENIKKMRSMTYD